MFCIKCGSQMPENVVFCSQCGTKMYQPAQQQEQPPVPVQPPVQPPVQQVPVQPPVQQQVPVQPQAPVQPQVIKNRQENRRIPNVISETTKTLLSENGLKEQNDAYFRPYAFSYWCQIDGSFCVFDEGIMFSGYENEIDVCNISIYYSDIKESIFMLGGRGTTKNTVFIELKNGKTFQFYVDDARKYSKFINSMVSNAKNRDFSEPEFYVIPINQGQPLDDTKVRIVTAIPVILMFISLLSLDIFIIFIFYFFAIYLSFEFCTQDIFILKKHGFDTDELKKCNFITPLYLYKRSQIINQKSTDLIIWCVFMFLHFII